MGSCIVGYFVFDMIIAILVFVYPSGAFVNLFDPRFYASHCVEAAKFGGDMSSQHALHSNQIKAQE
jgi:hypothetical protein